MLHLTTDPAPARPWERHTLEVRCDTCGARAPGSRIQDASPLGPICVDHARLLAAKLGGFMALDATHICPNCQQARHGQQLGLLIHLRPETAA